MKETFINKRNIGTNRDVLMGKENSPKVTTE